MNSTVKSSSAWLCCCSQFCLNCCSVHQYFPAALRVLCPSYPAPDISLLSLRLLIVLPCFKAPMCLYSLELHIYNTHQLVRL